MAKLTNPVDRASAIAGAAIVVISIPFIVNEGLVWLGVIMASGGIALIISSFMWSRARAEGRFDDNDRPIVHTERWAQWPISQDDRRYVVGNDNPAATEICFERYGPEWAGEARVRLGDGKLMAVKISQLPFSERSVLRFEYEERRYGTSVQTNTPLDIIFAVVAIIRIFLPDITVYDIHVPIPTGHEAEAKELVNRYNALMRG
jgi:hypothetical protein